MISIYTTLQLEKRMPAVSGYFSRVQKSEQKNKQEWGITLINRYPYYGVYHSIHPFHPPNLQLTVGVPLLEVPEPYLLLKLHIRNRWSEEIANAEVHEHYE